MQMHEAKKLRKAKSFSGSSGFCSVKRIMVFDSLWVGHKPIAGLLPEEMWVLASADRPSH